MDRHTEAVDVYSIFKPVFFVSKVLGLSPYSAVGDIGNRRIIVTLSAIIYSLGMFILNVGVLAYGVHAAIFTWENICSSVENIITLEALCLAISAYFISLLWCRQTAKNFAKLNHLIGGTYYCVWKLDLQLLIIIQAFFVIMIATAGVLDISLAIRESFEFHTVLFYTLYYVSDFAGFMAEHQFFAVMHILKRTVQSWNNHIDAVSDYNDVINSPLHRKLMSGQKSVLFTVSNKSVNSKHQKIHSKVVHILKLSELHASACDIAESVNAVYSPVLLLSVAKSFTSLTHTLYYVLMSFIVQKKSFFCKLSDNTCYFVWLIYCSARLVWLVHFTDLTAKEVSHKV
jgi:hypothetical protein